MNAEEYGEEVLAEQRRQTRALEALAAPLQERRVREQRAAFPVPRRLLGGARGTTCLLRALPGFSELWEKEVPPEYLWRAEGRSGGVCRAVSCVCGAMTALEGGLVECSGGCGRWFLPLESSVRVKRFAEMTG